jgi:hypothetical protein
VEALSLYGRGAAPVDELLTRGWLDTLEDGRVAAHDWDDHQYEASHEITKAWEADRLRGWRLRRKSESAEKTVEDTTSQDSTGQGYVHVRTSTDDVRTEEPRRNGADRTTCPRCGDLLDDKDPNVMVADHGRQLWHRACPAGLTLTADWPTP